MVNAEEAAVIREAMSPSFAGESLRGECEALRPPPEEKHAREWMHNQQRVAREAFEREQAALLGSR